MAETTAADFEVHSVCITKRAADQLRRVSAATGRTFDSLMEAAIEDACIMSERDYPPETVPDPHTSDWVQLSGD